MADCAIGIDLGGTNLKGALVDGSGCVLHERRTATEAEQGPEHVMARLLALADDVCAAAGVARTDLAGVGVGAPGPLDLEAGVVVTMPNLPGWEDFPLRAFAAERLGVPVVLENDANAAAYGECWVGAARDVRTMILLTLGTGIGGGVVLDGRIWHGYRSGGGELGHTILREGGRRCGCGARGCLEAYASATAVVARAKEALAAAPASSLHAVRAKRGAVTCTDVFAAAAAGDATAAALVDETGRLLGAGIHSLVNVISPEMVVLAGGMAEAGEALFGPVRETVRAMAFDIPGRDVRIEPGALGEGAGVVGAAGCALAAAGGQE
jgi:glucokinase